MGTRTNEHLSTSCFSFIGDLDRQHRHENQRDDFDIRHFQVHDKSEKTSMIYKIYKTTSIKKKEKKYSHCLLILVLVYESFLRS